MIYDSYPEFDYFEDGLNELSIKLDNNQKQQFIEYFKLLIERNKVMNLTAITDFKEVISKHFLDSLSIVKLIRPNNERILDLGTGAGFPGIPLKIVFPEIDIVLLDSLKKRLIFIDDIIKELNLKKIRTIHGRAEDYGREKQYREQYDMCVSRAVAKLSVLSEYSLPFIRKGGYFIPYKSGKIEEELEESKSALKILGASVEKVIEFHLPGTDISRALVMIKKIETTPKNYPRGAGKPAKEPL